MADNELDETTEMDQDEMDSNAEEEESLQDAPETSTAGGKIQQFINLFNLFLF